MIFINKKDNKNRPIMISLELDKALGTYKVNNITSLYGRNNTVNFIENLYKEGLVLKENKKINQWLKSIGV